MCSSDLFPSHDTNHESITNEGLKKWNKIGLEANVAEGEDIHKCHEELKNLVKGMMFGVSTYNELNIIPILVFLFIHYLFGCRICN